MAQLIKLLDYVSRYETNPFHYPTQYIRLKQENWQRINDLWEIENEREAEQETQNLHTETTNNSFFKWNPFKAKENENVEEKFERNLPRSKKQLTQHFLNELYPFQLKWASSTISQVSYTDQKYNSDTTLRNLLQRLPDIYLLMYYPIFNIKKAPVEGEIILISPIGIDLISLVQTTSESTVYVGTDRTWSIESGAKKAKILSPLIALKRSEQILKGILNRYEISFPIYKTVISETSSILYTNEPYNTSIIGKDEFPMWLEEKRNLTSPLKNMQLKVIEALLRHCQSTSVRRPEWEMDDDDYITPSTYEEKQE
ncbi:NERD domain-containing protein [Pseudogracilibacillus sp. SE30717A]|uniref:NERD domain-containing protein n=1 Tax=Pseudogracilibacillus sp. SE30717A TaxID=3098293 RepID=UPI00300DF25D